MHDVHTKVTSVKAAATGQQAKREVRRTSTDAKIITRIKGMARTKKVVSLDEMDDAIKGQSQIKKQCLMGGYAAARVCTSIASSRCRARKASWNGNRAMDSSGLPVLYDSALYFGDRECNIAMTKLFGGFHRERNLVSLTHGLHHSFLSVMPSCHMYSGNSLRLKPAGTMRTRHGPIT